MEDITTKGSLNYRDLQKENNDDYTKAVAAEEAKLLSEYDSYSQSRAYDPEENAPKHLKSSLYDNATPWGESIFDNKGAHYENEYNQLQDIRANNQPWYSKLASGLVKGIGLAGTTFLDGTIGLVYGISSAIVDKDASRLWDNEVSNALQDFNRAMEVELPNYETREEEESPWYNNLGSINFWADGFLKNMGFTVGAFYSGGVWTKPIKWGGKIMQIAGKAAEQAGKANKARRAITAIGEGIEAGGTSLRSNGMLARIQGSMFQAVNEGRIEANNLTYDSRKLQVQQAQDAYERKKQEILSNEYLDDNERLSELTKLDENMKITMSQIDENLKKAGLTDLLLNIPILAINNFWTFGKLYGQGFRNAKNAASKNVSFVARLLGEADKAATAADNSIAGGIRREGKRYGWEEIIKKKSLGKGLLTGLREGNEEMAQGWASEFSGYNNFYEDGPDTYYKAMSNPAELRKTMDSWKAASLAFANTYGNADRYEEFAIGALTGLFGTFTFGKSQNSGSSTWLGRGKMIGISGGIFGEFRSDAEQNRIGRSHVENMNRLLDEREKMDRTARVHSAMNQFGKAMEGYAKDDDKFNYQNASDNSIWMGINSFISTGREEDLKALLGMDFENMDDSELAAIAAATSSSPKDGFREKGSGKLITETSPEEDKKAMREELTKRKDKILKAIDAYKTGLTVVRNALNGKDVSEDEVSEAAWLYFKTASFSDRFHEVLDKNKDKIYNIVSAYAEVMKSMKTEYNPVFGPSYEVLKEQQAFFESLLSIKNSNGWRYSKFLNNNTKFLDGLAESELFKTLAESTGLDYLSLKEFLVDIADLGRLSHAKQQFEEKLNKMLEDPQTARQARQRIDESNNRIEDALNRTDSQKESKKRAMELIASQETAVSELEDMLNELVSNNSSDTDTIDLLKQEIKKRKTAEKVRENLVSRLEDAGENEEADPAVLNALAIFEQAAESGEELAADSEAIMEGLTALEEKEGKEARDAAEGILAQSFDAIKSLVEEAEKLQAEEPDVSEDFEKAVTARESKEAEESKEKETTDTAEQTGKRPNKGSTSRGKQKSGTGQRRTSNKKGTNKETLSSKKQARKPGPDPIQSPKPVNNPTTQTKKPSKSLEDKKAEAEEIVALVKEYPMFANWGPMQEWLNNTFPTLYCDVLADETYKGNSDIYDIMAIIIASLDKDGVFENWEADHKDVAFAVVDAIFQVQSEKDALLTNPVEEEKNREMENGPSTVIPTTEEAKNMEESGVKQNFSQLGAWMSLIREFPIHGHNLQPYHESAAFKQKLEEKLKNSGLKGKELKAAIQAEEKRIKAVYNYLKAHNAFSNVDKLRKGDEVRFMVDPSLNEQAGETVILMVAKDNDGNDVVVGAMRGANEIVQSEQFYSDAFIEDVANKFKNRADKDSTDMWNSGLSTHVSQTFVGKPLFTDEYIALNDIFEGSSDEIKIVVKNKNDTLPGKPGQPLLKMKTNVSGTFYYIPIIMDTYNESHAETSFSKSLEEQLNKARAISGPQEKCMAIKQVLESTFAHTFHVNIKAKSVLEITAVYRDGHQHRVFYSREQSSVYGADICKALQKAGLIIQVNKKLLSSGSVHSYSRMIGEIAKANIAKGYTRTVNNFFSLNPLNKADSDKFEELGAKPIKPAAAPAQEFSIKTYCTVGGKVYVVTHYPNGDTAITDQSGKKLDMTGQEDLVRKIEAVATINEEGRLEVEVGSGIYLVYSDTYYSTKTSEFLDAKVAEKLIAEARAKNQKEAKTSTDTKQEKATTPNSKEKDGDKSADKSTASDDKAATGAPVNVDDLFDSDEGAEEDKINIEDFVPEERDKDAKPLGELGFEGASEAPKPADTANQDSTKQQASEDTEPIIPKLWNNPKSRKAWEKLTKSQQAKVAGIKNFVFLQSLLYDINKEKNPEIIEDIVNWTVDQDKSYTREVKGKVVEGTSLEKELEWLDKVLPQLSREQKVVIADALLKLGDSLHPVLAYGKFQNGVITLYRKAACGTVYHEAFHYVSQTLLKEEELNELYEEGAKKYGITDPNAIEEELAEDFRKYMQMQEAPIIGTIVKLFRKIKHGIQSFIGNEAATSCVFYKIANGKYAQPAKPDFLGEVDAYVNKSPGWQLNKNSKFRTDIVKQIIYHFGIQGIKTYGRDEMIKALTEMKSKSAQMALEEINKREMEYIKDNALANGTFMKAPNGKNTNLTEKQWLQVRTTAFKQWFGDWENDPKNASKIVDLNGEPAVMQHTSTKGRFEGEQIFRRGVYGGKSGNGIYFAGHRYAKFANMKGSYTYYCFLNVRNPLTKDFAIENNIDVFERVGRFIRGVDAAKLEKISNEYGFDGTYMLGALNEMTVFDPNQIKSATDNNGDFSTTDDNIEKFMTPQGELYGFVDRDGNIYLDETMISPEHPIHEYTHLWDRIVRQKNPKLWKRGVELMRQTSEWEKVLNSEVYGQKWIAQGISGEELDTLIASEVHSRLTGVDGEKILNNIGVKEGASDIVSKLKSWLHEFWKGLKSTFGNWSRQDLDKLTVKEFNRMPLRDLAEAGLKDYIVERINQTQLNFNRDLISRVDAILELEQMKETYRKKGYDITMDGSMLAARMNLKTTIKYSRQLAKAESFLDYMKHKYDFYKLSSSQRNLLKEWGVSESSYNTMTEFEKEEFWRCRS